MLEEVADAQLQVARTELPKPVPVAPFQYFFQAMDIIKPQAGSFLDVGCGVGHYGKLVTERYPQLVYTGTDASRYMVDRAKALCPQANYEVRAFQANNFGDYDIVLVSAVMEYAGVWGALETVLQSFKKYLILHRLRQTEGESYTVDEPTYCGHRENFYVWSLPRLREAIGEHAILKQEIFWKDSNQMTLVIEK